MEKIQVSVLSDGTIDGTKIIDQYGRVLDNVLSINYSFDVMTQDPIVTIQLINVPVSIYDKGASLGSLKTTVVEGRVEEDSFCWTSESGSNPIKIDTSPPF